MNLDIRPQQARSQVLLVVDTDRRWLTLLARSMPRSGYRVRTASGVSDAIDICLSENPAHVLVDIDEPAHRELVRELRDYTAGGIIATTTHDVSNEAAISALREGADVVLVKPFTTNALLAQMGALARRAHERSEEYRLDAYTYGELNVDFVERSVHVAGERIHVSAIQFRLLEALAHNAGRVLTHDQLSEYVWGSTSEGSSETIRAHIRNLRRALGDNARQPRFILTERQIGYYMPHP